MCFEHSLSGFPGERSRGGVSGFPEEREPGGDLPILAAMGSRRLMKLYSYIGTRFLSDSLLFSIWHASEQPIKCSPKTCKFLPVLFDNSYLDVAFWNVPCREFCETFDFYGLTRVYALNSFGLSGAVRLCILSLTVFWDTFIVPGISGGISAHLYHLVPSNFTFFTMGEESSGVWAVWKWLNWSENVKKYP